MKVYQSKYINAMCTTCITVDQITIQGKKKNRLIYFQLEIDYYSDEANKNKYTNFQLKASIKNNLKIAEDQIAQGIVLTTRT